MTGSDDAMASKERRKNRPKKRGSERKLASRRRFVMQWPLPLACRLARAAGCQIRRLFGVAKLARRFRTTQELYVIAQSYISITCLWATTCMCWWTRASSSLPATKKKRKRDQLNARHRRDGRLESLQLGRRGQKQTWLIARRSLKARPSANHAPIGCCHADTPGGVSRNSRSPSFYGSAAARQIRRAYTSPPPPRRSGWMRGARRK